MAPRAGHAWLLGAALLLAALPAHAQRDLGHKILGTLGLDAAVQRDAGLYLSDRLVWFHAGSVKDRDGNELPIGLDLDAIANGIGAGFTWEVVPHAFVDTALAVPVASVRGSTERPEASIDRLGLGDLFVQPLALGGRLHPVDLVAGYAFYAPTGRFTPGSSTGVGRGHWTHQLSAGGTLFFDRRRAFRCTVLGSWDHNGRKRGIDITRGDTVQLQGGIGGPLHPLLVAGLAGYALWQVEDDAGADLPAALRGARERAFGLGPELSVPLRAIRTRLTARYTHDLAVRSRPQGGVLTLELTFVAWRPD